MNARTSRAIVFFIIFFTLGLGLYHLFQTRVTPAKPMVTQQQAAAGGVSKVAAQVSPSVVGISSVSRSTDRLDPGQVESSGSGVIIDKAGYIVTNNHVVSTGAPLTVTLADGSEKKASIVGTDPRTDLALIKIDPSGKLTPAEFGDSEKLVVGEEVVAIGNPLGQRFARSVTAGIVSGLNRLLTSEEGYVFRLIQTDAAINPGNSGGALVNLQGKLIGINSAKISAEGFEGMGFSIPSNQVQAVVAALKKDGRVYRPVMGTGILGEVTPELASYYNIPVNYGVIVMPSAGGPAARAGMRGYDIVTAIDGQKVTTGAEMQEQISARKIGQTIKVMVVRPPTSRNGSFAKTTLTVKLARG
ncbi:MAG: S1C family serine protease [Deltaproteobacteria bacterium]